MILVPNDRLSTSLHQNILFPSQEPESRRQDDVKLQTKDKEERRNWMSMLAFVKKGTEGLPQSHCISVLRHTSPHLLCPLVGKTLSVILCDGFNLGNRLGLGSWAQTEASCQLNTPESWEGVFLPTKENFSGDDSYWLLEYNSIQFICLKSIHNMKNSIHIKSN